SGPGNTGFRKGGAIITFSKTVALVAGVRCLERRGRFWRGGGGEWGRGQDPRGGGPPRPARGPRGARGGAGGARFCSGPPRGPLRDRRRPAPGTCTGRSGAGVVRAGRDLRGAGRRTPPADCDVLRPRRIDGTLHRDGP